MTAPRPLAPIRSASVLLPTYQGADFLERCLAGLAAQAGSVPFDVLAIDSGSTDGTLELLARAAADFPVPLRVESIHKAEFDHGDTRNLLASRSAGDLLVFLTQDAIPVGERWLATLVANFDDPLVAAADCRNAPRPDARPATAVLSAGDLGYATERRETRLPPPAEYAALPPQEKRVLWNFNDVASAVRREVWERHPFPRTDFGEDVLMARALLEAGYTVVYDAEAVVEHSHDHDAAETRARAAIDGRFNAEWLGRVAIESEQDARTLAKRFVEPDRAAVAALGLDADAARAAERELGERRLAAFLGLWEGGRSARRRPPTALLDDPRLKVLLVAHGFPPDTWAGTEVYTLELGKALQRLGHEVVVLTRAPAGPDGPPDFAVTEDEFDGLRVLRLTHRLVHEDLRQTFRQPKVEAAFREVLAGERPDLVHFQHLVHLSVGLVEVAREHGLPTLVHCHDYWALCARVQLIRPDGERCPSNMGAGCLLCVRERFLGQVPRAARVGAAVAPLLDAVSAMALRGPKHSRRHRAFGGYAHLRERERVVPAAYAAADLQVSPSRFLREKLLESGAFDPHAFVFSDNGLRIDHVDALAKRPDPQGRVRFGFVGSLVWYKGGETLVRALSRLDPARAVLHVHGAFDPDRDPHHAALQELAGPGVRFLGRFDNSRLSEVYAEIDVLVVPSVWYENSPITIHEAHLTRTPVVASDLGGMAEYVRDGVDGLHFRVGDADDLARVLRRFLDEPDLVERLSRDFPRIKAIEENARETEFRYRALAAVRRPRGPGLLVERPGRATTAREGACLEQGGELLLLLPGARADYDLSVAGPGERELEVELRALGPERELELGGRALLDGAELGALGPLRASGEDATRSHRFTVRLGAGPARLRLEAGDAHLRVAAVRVRGALVRAEGVRA